MDIERCFEILELDHSASPDELKQAYKDMVNIWHPDRFSNNPRLKLKAEERLKEINSAYETLRSSLSSETTVEPEKEKAVQTKAGNRAESNGEHEYRKSKQDAEIKNKTETFVEAGTGIVLSLWSYLSSAIRTIVAEAKTEMEQSEPNQWQRKGNVRGKGRGMGKGKGRGRRGGMGRRGGGKG